MSGVYQQQSNSKSIKLSSGSYSLFLFPHYSRLQSIEDESVLRYHAKMEEQKKMEEIQHKHLSPIPPPLPQLSTEEHTLSIGTADEQRLARLCAAIRKKQCEDKSIASEHKELQQWSWSAKSPRLKSSVSPPICVLLNHPLRFKA
jgi:hypothetical protein